MLVLPHGVGLGPRARGLAELEGGLVREADGPAMPEEDTLLDLRRDRRQRQVERGARIGDERVGDQADRGTKSRENGGGEPRLHDRGLIGEAEVHDAVAQLAEGGVDVAEDRRDPVRARRSDDLDDVGGGARARDDDDVLVVDPGQLCGDRGARAAGAGVVAEIRVRVADVVGRAAADDDDLLALPREQTSCSAGSPSACVQISGWLVSSCSVTTPKAALLSFSGSSLGLLTELLDVSDRVST